MEAVRHLKETTEDALSPAERVERVQLMASLSRARGDFEQARVALLDLADRWKDDPALVAPIHLDLAETFMKLKQPKQAESHADRVLRSEGSEAKVADPVLASAMRIKAESLVQQGQPLAAVEAYQRLLERFESSQPLAQQRFEAGRLLFQKGDHQGAEQLWSRLRGTPNELLFKVGQEKLEDAKFRDEYDRYIQRIPAMSNPPKGAR
jgi:tetratricopeptide (TPR) repeat protein